MSTNPATRRENEARPSDPAGPATRGTGGESSSKCTYPRCTCTSGPCD